MRIGKSSSEHIFVQSSFGSTPALSCFEAVIVHHLYVSYVLTSVEDTNDALDQNTMSEQGGSELDGSTLVGSESASAESSSDQSWGNTGPLPGEEDAPDDTAQAAIEAAQSIAQSAQEDPAMYNHVISSGERAKASRERLDDDVEEQSEGNSSHDGEDKQSERK